MLLNLKKKSNLSIREIAGILGINRGIVSRVKACRPLSQQVIFTKKEGFLKGFIVYIRRPDEKADIPHHSNRR
jgi:hypothetical protein